ncbi:biotin transporter BioY [Nocardioidaceae bacterium]|nr:biotin transporter BioY [Nocardioidaceae bacterium]
MPIGVPITAQSLGVMLVGAILGARRGFLALLLFVVLVAVGLPLLSSGAAGLGVFVGPTGGFVIGWPFAAYAVGWLTERIGTPYSVPRGIVANLLGGIVVIYAFGIVGLALVGDVTLLEATTGSAVFVPGDVAKAVIAALVAKGVHAAYPGLIPARAARTPKDPAGV